MKRILIYAVLCVSGMVSQSQGRTDEDRRIEAAQVTLWKGKLEEAKNMPSQERIATLWLGLRNMGFRKAGSEHSQEVEALYQALQFAIIATPGHAQYFADKLEQIRSNDKTKQLYDYKYYQNQYIRETLIYLPSPETVRVLGNYLYDTRDAPPPENFGRDILGIPANPVLPAWVLTDLGIRDAPVKPPYDLITGNVAPWRSWWEDVKSGKRTLSFVGQKVEYRFKPDGTWDTIALANPPDDGPKPVKTVNEPKGKVPGTVPSVPDEARQTGGNGWAWIIVAMIALLAGVLWQGVRPPSC